MGRGTPQGTGGIPLNRAPLLPLPEAPGSALLPPGQSPAPSSASSPSVLAEGGPPLRSLRGLCAVGLLLHLLYPAPRLPTVRALPLLTRLLLPPPLPRTFLNTHASSRSLEPPPCLSGEWDKDAQVFWSNIVPGLLLPQLHRDAWHLCRYLPAVADHCADLCRVLLWLCTSGVLPGLVGEGWLGWGGEESCGKWEEKARPAPGPYPWLALLLG